MARDRSCKGVTFLRMLMSKIYTQLILYFFNMDVANEVKITIRNTKKKRRKVSSMLTQAPIFVSYSGSGKTVAGSWEKMRKIVIGVSIEMAPIKQVITPRSYFPVSALSSIIFLAIILSPSVNWKAQKSTSSCCSSKHSFCAKKKRAPIYLVRTSKILSMTLSFTYK